MSLSHVQLFVTPWIAVCQASQSITNSQSLLKLMSIESVMTSNNLVLYHPLLLPPLIFPSNRAFSNESVLPIMCPKYWSFSFSTSQPRDRTQVSCIAGLFFTIWGTREAPSLMSQASRSQVQDSISDSVTPEPTLRDATPYSLSGRWLMSQSCFHGDFELFPDFSWKTEFLQGHWEGAGYPVTILTTGEAGVAYGASFQLLPPYLQVTVQVVW